MSINFTKMSKKQLVIILQNIENSCKTFEIASKEEINLINPEWHEGRRSAFLQASEFIRKAFCVKG